MLREILTLIFDAPLTKAEACDYLEGWASLVKASRLTCFDGFLTTLDERLDSPATAYSGVRDTSKIW